MINKVVAYSELLWSNASVNPNLGNYSAPYTVNALTGVTHFSKGITSGVAIPVGSGGTGKTSVTSNSFLVGNGSSAMVEKTPAQVLSLIGAQGAMTEMTTQEVTDFLTELGDF